MAAIASLSSASRPSVPYGESDRAWSPAPAATSRPPTHTHTHEHMDPHARLRRLPAPADRSAESAATAARRALSPMQRPALAASPALRRQRADKRADENTRLGGPRRRGGNGDRASGPAPPPHAAARRQAMSDTRVARAVPERGTSPHRLSPRARSKTMDATPLTSSRRRRALGGAIGRSCRAASRPRSALASELVAVRGHTRPAAARPLRDDRCKCAPTSHAASRSPKVRAAV